MRVAKIDLGTNTFHLMLAEVSDNSHAIFYRERIPVKVGERGINKGEITNEAIERALNALQAFQVTIENNQIEKVFGTATSAIRNAKNGTALVKKIKDQTGIEIEIISGIREAELIQLGAREALDFGEEKSLVMDIGGGSIEFIIADQETTYWMKSFEIGGQRLVERFHNSDPIAASEIERLRAHFEAELTALFEACNQFKPTVLVGCSGTFDTLSDIHCESMGIKRDPNDTEFPLPVASFQAIHADLLQQNRAERLQIPGMIEMRVDMIVVASILVEFILQRLALQKIRVSAYALKEGILFNVINQIQAS